MLDVKVTLLEYSDLFDDGKVILSYMTPIEIITDPCIPMNPQHHLL